MICNKILFKLGKNGGETYGMLPTAFRPSCINQASDFEWHKRFKESRQSVRDEKRSVVFPPRHAPVHNSILVTDYLTRMGIKTVPHPPYSPDLAPCHFWLFPKLRGCHYETIEEMKEAVTKVIDTITQEDFHRAFHMLL